MKTVSTLAVSTVLCLIVATLSIPAFSQSDTTAINLSDVIIYNKIAKVKKLGTHSFTPMVWIPGTSYSNNNVHEIATLITIKAPSKLLTVNALGGGKNKADLNNSTDSVTYRLHIYGVKDGHPDDISVGKSFIKSFAVSDKKLSFNLSRENLHFTTDFFISLEHVPDQNQGKYPLFSFRAKIKGKGCFVKNTKDGVWKMNQGGSAEIFAEVEQH